MKCRQHRYFMCCSIVWIWFSILPRWSFEGWTSCKCYKMHKVTENILYLTDSGICSGPNCMYAYGRFRRSKYCWSISHCWIFTCFRTLDIIRSLCRRSWREQAASWAAHRAADTFIGTEPDAAKTWALETKDMRLKITVYKRRECRVYVYIRAVCRGGIGGHTDEQKTGWRRNISILKIFTQSDAPEGKTCTFDSNVYS